MVLRDADKESDELEIVTKASKEIRQEVVKGAAEQEQEQEGKRMRT